MIVCPLVAVAASRGGHGAARHLDRRPISAVRTRRRCCQETTATATDAGAARVECGAVAVAAGGGQGAACHVHCAPCATNPTLSGAATADTRAAPADVTCGEHASAWGAVATGGGHRGAGVDMQHTATGGGA